MCLCFCGGTHETQMWNTAHAGIHTTASHSPSHSSMIHTHAQVACVCVIYINNTPPRGPTTSEPSTLNHFLFIFIHNNNQGKEAGRRSNPPHTHTHTQSHTDLGGETLSEYTHIIMHLLCPHLFLSSHSPSHLQSHPSHKHTGTETPAAPTCSSRSSRSSHDQIVVKNIRKRWWGWS